MKVRKLFLMPLHILVCIVMTLIPWVVAFHNHAAVPLIVLAPEVATSNDPDLRTWQQEYAGFYGPKSIAQAWLTHYVAWYPAHVLPASRFWSIYSLGSSSPTAEDWSLRYCWHEILMTFSLWYISLWPVFLAIRYAAGFGGRKKRGAEA